eukprot:TRINITY_DN2968_c0_g1_i1.p1 TRINITY_DN2968_c0_g1~~TRINITY_DN2968_c0_g1_i1.p1  ORF type:complete len:539 (-),score=104.54 TRINITY_DN2968_c0_g1_i1:998-2614(-)
MSKEIEDSCTDILRECKSAVTAVNALEKKEGTPEQVVQYAKNVVFKTSSLQNVVKIGLETKNTTSISDQLYKTALAEANNLNVVIRDFIKTVKETIHSKFDAKQKFKLGELLKKVLVVVKKILSIAKEIELSTSSSVNKAPHDPLSPETYTFTKGAEASSRLHDNDVVEKSEIAHNHITSILSTKRNNSNPNNTNVNKSNLIRGLANGLKKDKSNDSYNHTNILLTNNDNIIDRSQNNKGPVTFDKTQSPKNAALKYVSKAIPKSKANSDQITISKQLFKFSSPIKNNPANNKVPLKKGIPKYNALKKGSSKKGSPKKSHIKPTTSTKFIDDKETAVSEKAIDKTKVENSPKNSDANVVNVNTAKTFVNNPNITLDDNFPNTDVDVYNSNTVNTNDNAQNTVVKNDMSTYNKYENVSGTNSLEIQMILDSVMNETKKGVKEENSSSHSEPNDMSVNVEVANNSVLNTTNNRPNRRVEAEVESIPRNPVAGEPAVFNIWLKSGMTDDEAVDVEIFGPAQPQAQVNDCLLLCTQFLILRQ